MTAQMQMPKYKCHKEVWALKIKEITSAPGSAVFWMHPEDGRFAPIELPIEFMEKHKPEGGGYYVTYKGGYKSFSPADAFESGYSKLKPTEFD